jgi:hypothetical protein
MGAVMLGYWVKRNLVQSTLREDVGEIAICTYGFYADWLSALLRKSRAVGYNQIITMESVTTVILRLRVQRIVLSLFETSSVFVSRIKSFCRKFDAECDMILFSVV